MALSASSKNINIARPYALAAFEVAREKKTVSAWKTLLDTAAMLANEPAIIALLTNPEVAPAKLFDLLYGVLTALLSVSTEQKNFLLLLAQNKRLILLSAIAELFDHYYASLEKTSNVRVITAIEAEADFRQKLAQVLTKNMHRDVTLHCEVDPAIIGGAIIYVDDKVIDGSIRGKLTRLLQNLTG